VVNKTVTFTVPTERAGQRLDKLVVAETELGRRRVSELFADGRVTIRGRVATKGESARADDEVTVALRGDDRPSPESQLALEVRLETEHFVIVAKPAGQPSAPLRGEPGTLAGALLGRYPEMANVGHSPREPGIVHRLDTFTSGLMIAARSKDAFSRLHQALRAGALVKKYLAVVANTDLPEGGVIDSAIAPDRRNPRRVLVGETAALRSGKNRARAAVTRWRVKQRTGEWALLEVDVSRALRHQIRAHLASLGHPIAGDQVYGGPPAPVLGERHALHASYVAWAGDETIDAFAVEEPLPPDLASLMVG